MGLNDIDLSSVILADLYKSSLLELPEVKTNRKNLTDNKDEWRLLGNNLKNILIIVKYKDAVHIHDEQLEFLITMLAACKLSLADVSIVNINNYPDSHYKELTDHLKSKIIFLFGVEPVAFGLPVGFPHFQIQLFSACTFLYSPALNELKENKVLKSKLWVCLRCIFGI